MRTPKVSYGISLACVLLGGCAVRPLPENEEDPKLPIFGIVRRIQCEAATAVKAVYQEEAFQHLSKDLKSLNKRIAAAQSVIAAKQRKLEAESGYGVREEELRDSGDAALMMRAQIQQARNQIKTTDEKAALDREEYRLEQQADNIASASKLLTEIKLMNVNLEAMRTERVGKRYRRAIEFEGHNAVFQFDFEVTENNNYSSQGSVVWPVLLGGLGGTFTMGYDVGDKRERLAKRTVKLAASFGELAASFERRNGNEPDDGERDGGDKLYCGDVVPAIPDPLPRAYPMTGNIGLAGVVKEYLHMLKNGKFKSGGEAYTDKIQFTTSINGALKPGVDLARREGPSVKVSGGIEGIRKDVHILTIQLTPPEDGEKSPATQTVVITQMPSVRVRADVLRLPPLH